MDYNKLHFQQIKQPAKLRNLVNKVFLLPGLFMCVCMPKCTSVYVVFFNSGLGQNNLLAC